MLKHSFFRLLVFGLAILFSKDAIGQPPRGPFVISPQVREDNSVTFRYLAPQAKEVKLSGQFLTAPLPMSKDSLGIWEVTTDPIHPDIYPYSFNVDGITVMDPANVAFFPNERFKASLVDVKGKAPMDYDMKNVPHGKVTYAYYPSLQGSTGSVVVYTPPGYGKDPTKKYPVFYLVSGTTDTEEAFYKVGRTNFILDNLIAEGKAIPMIVVMPYGNPLAKIAEQQGLSKPTDLTTRDGEDAVIRAKYFEMDLIDNVMPFVEKNYSTIAKRESRAIGGFSRGGGQILRAGFGNVDKFAWICCYAANLSKPEMEKNYLTLVEQPSKTNKDLKLLWISVGSDDFMYPSTKEFMDYLKLKNINYKSLVTTGGHTWMNVKKYVTETAQLLFKEQ